MNILIFDIHEVKIQLGIIRNQSFVFCLFYGFILSQFITTVNGARVKSKITQKEKGRKNVVEV